MDRRGRINVTVNHARHALATAVTWCSGSGAGPEAVPQAGPGAGPRTGSGGTRTRGAERAPAHSPAASVRG